MTIFRLLPISILASAALHAAIPEKIGFNQHVRPILSDNCFACHGTDAKHREAKLRLDQPESALADREGIRAVVPGKPDQSELWLRITNKDEDEVMPPPKSHKKLKDEERAILKKWIEQGAPYQKHWAFEQPVKSEPPKTPGARNGIDGFIAGGLAREGLAMMPEADKPTLIRRVAFTLTGLPPTTAEVDAFLGDNSADAYEKMVERYFASPHYGEEMARHWLDVARYADTHGLHLDNERQMWAYRDWVVNAFNANQPFDQFTIEQLAGDLLPNPTQSQLIATGFNRCNVTTSEGGSIDAEFVFRYAVDRASTTAQAWMGLTAGCAVCHDHKFDPLSQKEFYSLYAFFHSAADPAMDGNSLLTRPVMKIDSPAQKTKLAELDAQVAAKQKELDESASKISYTDPAEHKAQAAPVPVETVWLEDEFPPGAKVQSLGHPLKLRSAAQGAQVLSGKLAIKRSGQGTIQDSFEAGAAPIIIPQKAELFVHVFLDPADVAKSVMIQFHKGGWKHRAVWGDYKAIEWGKEGTTERVLAGPLPQTGKWVRLSIPAEKIGLHAGDQCEGFAITQSGGLVYWDKMGVTGLGDPVGDPSQSYIAWRKSRAGRDSNDVPAELRAWLKEGPAKTRTAAEEKQLRGYYLANVCTKTKPQFAALQAGIASLRKQRDDLGKQAPSTFIYNDLPTPRESFVMMRGAYDKPGEKVEPNTPAIFPPLRKPDAAKRATRLDLAKWLVSAENPVVARVAVNRIWQQIFGIGIVKTSGDFGSQGQPPSHPELLDWLAITYREGGWDTKALVRLMLRSAAFRQSSRITPALTARDPENRLLAHGPRFRLDAEVIRDNALFVSGLINLQPGGAGAKPYQPGNIWEPVGFAGSNTRNYKQDSGPALYRRSIYNFIKRTAPPPFMSNFDAPNREQICVVRERSNTPLQALQLMNDIQHVEAARSLAQRAITEGGATPGDRIKFLFRTVLSRMPGPDEQAILQKQLAAHAVRYKQDPEAAKKLLNVGESKPKTGMDPAELASHALLASTLLNLDETITRN